MLVDIEKLPTPELKAMGYDQLIWLDTIQKNIQLIQKELKKREEENVPNSKE